MEIVYFRRIIRVINKLWILCNNFVGLYKQHTSLLGFAQNQYRMIMSDIVFLIANTYDVIVYFLDKQAWSTSQTTSYIYCYWLRHNDHYVKIDLHGSHPISTIRAFCWMRNNVYCSTECITPNAPHTSCNIRLVDISNNYLN
uniref:Uncharacterized protein n=1 Tax=Lactuca sativa TaxID=4236 RepID=A0A9R1XCI6_LACSA|nr:hypothetical protein LSAT_V11C500260650 [Lactuca sativa]